MTAAYRKVAAGAAKPGNLVSLRAARDRDIAAEIRKARLRCGITWLAMAQWCGVSIGTAQRWGSGVRTPEKAHLDALDRLFDKKRNKEPRASGDPLKGK